MPYSEIDPLSEFIDWSHLQHIYDEDAEDHFYPEFDDKKYHFLCIEIQDEPDAHDDWIGVLK